MFRAGGSVDYFSLMRSLDALCEISVESVADFLVDANIVVRELAHISNLNSEDLRLLCSAECQSSIEGHNPKDDGLNGYISVD